MPNSRSISLCFVFSLLVSISSAQAAPQISILSPRGLRIGAATLVTLEGSDLGLDTRILLNIPGMTSRFQGNLTPTRLRFSVTLPEGVQPGLFHLRAANSNGISNPIVVAVDDLPEVAFSARLDKLPVTLLGAIPDATVQRTVFQGKKGQRFVAEIQAKRLGSSIDPVVEIYDSRRVQIAFAQPAELGAGSNRLEAVLPADGEYALEIHDLLYRGGNPSTYRLRVGDLPYVDAAHPCVWSGGAAHYHELVGRVLGPFDRVSTLLEPRRAGRTLPARLPAVPHLGGPVPPVLYTEYPLYVETAAGGAAPMLALPHSIAGRLEKKSETDRYGFCVEPGTRLRATIRAGSAQSPIDAFLKVSAEDGTVIGESDDRADSTDSTLDFTVPAGARKVFVSVSDLLKRGGPAYVYQLSVAPADQPDFSISFSDAAYQVPEGGQALLKVQATRSRFPGPIELNLDQTLPGLELDNAIIPAGANVALVNLKAKPGQKPIQDVVALVGKGAIKAAALERVAQRPEQPSTRNQPWLREEMGIAIVEEAPVKITWKAVKDVLTQGQPLPVEVTLARRPGVVNKVRFGLTTTQIVPKQAGTQQEDRNKAVRLEGTPTLEPNQTSMKVNVLVPADLAQMPIDLAITADLLAPDGQQSTSTIVGLAKRFSVLPAPKAEAPKPMKKP